MSLFLYCIYRQAPVLGDYIGYMPCLFLPIYAILRLVSYTVYAF